MYEVYLERAAERELRRLHPDLFERVISRIRALGAEPRPPGSAKLVGSRQDWRLRIGDYRVLYEIDDSAHVVRVFRVRHRGAAYR